MGAGDLVKMIKKDEQDLAHVLIYGLGLSSSCRFPSEMRVKNVAQRVLASQAADFGSRLSRFKAEGRLLPDGSLNWRRGVYAVKVAEGFITTLVHVFTDEQADIAKHRIDAEHSHREVERHDGSVGETTSPLHPLGQLLLEEGQEGAVLVADPHWQVEAFGRDCQA